MAFDDFAIEMFMRAEGATDAHFGAMRRLLAFAKGNQPMTLDQVMKDVKLLVPLVDGVVERIQNKGA